MAAASTAKPSSTKSEQKKSRPLSKQQRKRQRKGVAKAEISQAKLAKKRRDSCVKAMSIKNRRVRLKRCSICKTHTVNRLRGTSSTRNYANPRTLPLHQSYTLKLPRLVKGRTRQAISRPISTSQITAKGQLQQRKRGTALMKIL